MVNEQINTARQVSTLQQQVSQLERTVWLMEERRQLEIERRRRRMAIIGGSVSLLLHIILLVYLGLVYRGGGGSGPASAGTYQLAILNEAELQELEQTSFDEIETEAIAVDQSTMTESAALTAAPAGVAELGATGAAMPTLSGSGGGDGGEVGLGGGGGGTTSFFGIGSKGNRFAFIIDISGSMGDARKLDIARGELIRAIEALPDYAHFYVILFNSEAHQPPMQSGWMRARNPLIRQFTSWLNDVSPGGGTAPGTSFMQVFSLEVRPDVIYFLTDGIFQDIGPNEIASMNRNGKRAIINTIQFGDRSGEDVLRQIARGSGGIYRYVPAEDGL